MPAILKDIWSAPSMEVLPAGDMSRIQAYASSLLGSVAACILGIHCVTVWLKAMMSNIASFGRAFKARRSSCFAISIFGPENFVVSGGFTFGGSPVTGPFGGGGAGGGFFSSFID